jgi:hypothetical protein
VGDAVVVGRTAPARRDRVDPRAARGRAVIWSFVLGAWFLVRPLVRGPLRGRWTEHHGRLDGPVTRTKELRCPTSPHCQRETRRSELRGCRRRERNQPIDGVDCGPVRGRTREVKLCGRGAAGRRNVRKFRFRPSTDCRAAR